VEREGRGEGYEVNRMEGKGREWKGRKGDTRGGEGMYAIGAGPPRIFGLEPPLASVDLLFLSGAGCSQCSTFHDRTTASLNH
jgi:hypothetical protein